MILMDEPSEGILEQGNIVHHGTGADLLADAEIQEKYCAV